MKKLLSLILCIVMALFAVACGSDTSGDSAGGLGGGGNNNQNQDDNNGDDNGDDAGTGGGGNNNQNQDGGAGGYVEIAIPKGWGGGAGSEYLVKLMEYYNEHSEWGNQPSPTGKYSAGRIKLLEQDVPTNPANITTHGGDIFMENRAGGVLTTQNHLVDITDIMTATIPGESETILDKIPEGYSAPFANYEGDKYFGAPSSQQFSGYTIDTEMWERDNLYIANALLNNDLDYASKVAEYEDEMLSLGFGAKRYVSNKYGITLWFSDYDGDGQHKYAMPGGKAVQNGQNGYAMTKEEFGAEGGLCVGPDGVRGTMDDGLPSSVIELLALCDYMKSDEFSSASTFYAPFAISGQFRDAHGNHFLEGLYGSLAGDQYEKSVLRFDSEDEKVRVVTGYTNEPLYPGIDYIKKPIVKEVVITPETGYYVSWMEDKFYAEAALEILNKEKYFGYAEGNYVSHTDTEKNFLFGGYTDQANRDTCAFLIEGSFWSMEANRAGVDSYAQLAQADDNAVNRRTEFASMPVNINEPVTEGNGDKNTLVSGGLAYISINGRVAGDPDKLWYCKRWIQFMFTEYVMAYHYWATHFMPLCLRDYDSVISNPDYQEFFSEIGLNERYYNQYHFERLRKLTSEDYSRRCYAIGNTDITINYRTQSQYYTKPYSSGIFGVGGTVNCNQSLRQIGTIATFEKSIYYKDTWANMYGNTYNNVPEADKVYNGITYTSGV